MTEPTPVPDEVGGGFRTVALHAASTRPDAPSGLPRRDRAAGTGADAARGEPGGADDGTRHATAAELDGRPAPGTGPGHGPGSRPSATPEAVGDLANAQLTPSSDPGRATMMPRDFRSADEVEAGIVALWREYGRGQARELRDRLVLHYAPLVKYVAGRVGTGLPSYVDVSDLIQSGIFGLVDAIEKFEPERGLKFETYAMQRIRGAILDDLRAQDWVPRSVRGRARDVERALERLEARLQRTASDGELADELGVTLEDLRDLYAQFQLTSVVALDELIVAGRGTASLAETLPDDRAEDPVANLVDRDNRRQLAEAIAQLSERDRIVVTLYYFENLTLAEIGKVLGVTESRVCQLHTRSVLRLRAKLVEPAEA